MGIGTPAGGHKAVTACPRGRSRSRSARRRRSSAPYRAMFSPGASAADGPLHHWSATCCPSGLFDPRVAAREDLAVLLRRSDRDVHRAVGDVALVHVLFVAAAASTTACGEVRGRRRSAPRPSAAGCRRGYGSSIDLAARRRGGERRRCSPSGTRSKSSGWSARVLSPGMRRAYRNQAPDMLMGTCRGPGSLAGTGRLAASAVTAASERSPADGRATNGSHEGSGLLSPRPYARGRATR